jgi:hypothetical protein
MQTIRARIRSISRSCDAVVCLSDVFAWAGDGTPDTFRIRIWWEVDGVENVVYDNGFNQGIGGGSIVVHTGK